MMMAVGKGEKKAGKGKYSGNGEMGGDESSEDTDGRCTGLSVLDAGDASRLFRRPRG